MRLNVRTYLECPLGSLEELALISIPFTGRLVFLATYGAMIISVTFNTRVALPIGTFVKVTVADV